MEATDAIDQLRDYIQAAKRIVVFTGAGISTESGIPDFRSPGGVWDKYKPINFQDFVASEEMRRESWRRKFATDAMMRQAQPNLGHRAVAKMVQQGQAIGVITQNIDGLHQAAGIGDEKVVELHGNATYASCLECHCRYSLAEVKACFDDNERLMDCRECGGMIKTATISFGQAMPGEAMAQAQALTLAADLFIVMGSSLVVYPAAGFPRAAQQNGARLVILNREATEQDQLADLVLHREIGPTMGAVLRIN